jgi:ABC-type multidrug transport system fused ATPase/permease subunit
MRYQALLYFLRPYKYLYGGILVVMLCASIVESLSLAAFFPVFASILGQSAQEAGGILRFITEAVQLLPVSDPIVAACAFLVGLYGLKAAVTTVREGLIARASGRVLYDVKNRMMERYADAPYEFFVKSKQGNLIYNSLTAPHRVALLLLRVPQMAAEFLKILAIIFVLFFVSPLVTFVLAVLATVYYLVIHHLSARVSYHLGKGRANASAAQTVITNEFLNGIRHIATYRTARQWLERFRRENDIFSRLYVKDMVWLAVPKSLMEFSAVALLLGLLLGLRLMSPESFSGALPKAGVFAMALVQLLPALTNFGRMRMEVLGAAAEAESVYHSLTGPMPRRRDGTKVLRSFERAIVFENVSFGYEEREILFEGLNLVIEKGRVTAIVGPSGVGKTTLINLILGLYEPSAGRILIDGVPLQEVKLESWLDKIGFVSQDPFIYHARVADNIIFGRNGHSMHRVVEVAKIANAHGFISELPEGYETVVGERGMKLSGGQQQRVAIARALLDDPEILILDEATSSLDSISEKLVQEAIENASRDRTVLIIAHRLSTVRYADKIIVLDAGRVVEEGSHQELIGRQGHYARLVTSFKDS